MSRPLAVICLAAGLGKRTKVSVPKVLLPLCGRTLAASALAAAAALEPVRTVVVLHHQLEKVQKSLQEACGSMFASLQFVDQGAPKGTGHAVQVAMQALADFEGDVLVIYGDCPLITTATLRELRELRGDAACSVLTAFPRQSGRPRPHPARRRRALRRHPRGQATVRRRSARSTRSTPASTASTARRCGPRSAICAQQRAGRATT
jgi:CTP:molybdopterin cytidylyltransferase MocA